MIRGYAVLYNVRSADRIGHEVEHERWEVILPGAFRRSLAGGRNVRCLVDHDPRRVLGQTQDGTLRLREDSRGVAFELRRRRLPRGFAGMSFGHRPLRVRQTVGLVYVAEADLTEITVCVDTDPCYPATKETVCHDRH